MTEVVDNVPVPDKPKRGRKSKAEMAAARAAKGEAPEKAASLPDDLGAALDFISGVNAGNCRLINGYIVATDNILTLAHPIRISPFQTCPETKTFRTALRTAAKDFTITETGSVLTIRGSKFVAHVPCLAGDLLPYVMPDGWQQPYPVDGAALRKAIAAVAPIVAESGERMVECCVHVRPNSAIATNGKILAECWHGQNFPPVNLPKASINALQKIKLNLVYFGVGFDPHDPNKFNSVTFWFDNGAWLKTQLYPDEYPDTDRIFDEMPKPKIANKDIPVEFFPTLERLKPFTDEDGTVWIACDEIMTSDATNNGAAVELTNKLPIDPEDMHIVRVDHLLLTRDHANAIEFSEDRVLLLGQGFRAVLVQMKG